MPDPYNTGTVTVANGSATVAGSGVAWLPALVVPGDVLWVPSLNSFSWIESVDNTYANITLYDEWEGGNGTNVDYVIFPLSWQRNDPSLTQSTTRQLLAYLTGAGIIYYVTGSAPDPGLGENGQYALKTNAGAWQLWLKQSGAWVLQGTPVGTTFLGAWSSSTAYVVNNEVTYPPTGATSSYVALKPSTNVVPGTDPTTWSLSAAAGEPGNQLLNGSGAPSSGTGNNGDFYLDTAANVLYGPKAGGAWPSGVSLVGPTGATGPAGANGTNGTTPVILGTSTSTIIAGLGSRTFFTQTGISWQPGERLIAASADLSISLSGLISSYSGGAVTLNVDEVAGAGSAASWTLSIGGNQGIEGPVGGPGPAGNQGPAPVISGTSSSTVSVGTGSQTFSTQVGIAWSFAQRLRIASADTSKVMEGTLSSYSGSTLTMNVDTVVGSGSASSWFISIAGEKGDQGAQGIQGEEGQGIQPNATGTLAQRSTYDNEPQGFIYLETDVSPFVLFVKDSNTTADWSSGNPIGGNIPIGDLGLVSQSVTQSFDLGMVG